MLQELNNRNASVELYRVIMMFGICLVHTVGQSDFRCPWLTRVAMSCVVGFVFISGYYGIKFRLSKVVNLYSLAILYCFLFPVIGGGYSAGGYLGAVAETWGAKWRFWFLHSYAVLMTIAPLVEDFFQHHKHSSVAVVTNVIPIFYVVFAWGFFSQWRIFSYIIPSSAGISGMGTVLVVLGIYVAARAFRICDVEKMLSVKYLIVIFVLACAILAACRYSFYLYNSPVQLIVAAVGFVFFRRMTIPQWLSKIVLYISPSMFAVYIIHAAIYFPGMPASKYGLINTILHSMLDDRAWNRYLAWFVTAFSVFMISLAVDAIRRVAMLPFRSFIQKMNGHVDDIPKKIAQRLVG